MRVLLVEDNLDLAKSIGEYLNLHECVCDFAYNGQMGLELAINTNYDLYVFDIAMPIMNGLQLCQKLRQEQQDNTPALFLTARDTLDDKLSGFAVGADDYLVKPFELSELFARIKAIHKRSVGGATLLKIEDLIVNLDTEEVSRGKSIIMLSPSNYKLLITLMRRSPALVSRQELEHIIWQDELPDSDSLRSHIYKLRKKIDKPFARQLIHTIKGRGYRIS